MKERSKPLSPAVYWATGGLFAAMLLGFVLVLRADLQRSRPIEVSAYAEPVPQELVWQLTEGGSEELITLDGYVFLRGEVIQWWKNYILLYDTETGDYRRLATTMVCREEIRDFGGDGLNQSYGGIAALVKTAELERPVNRYEICILYGTNHHEILAHTGLMLKGGAA